jgi:hypothetical protein
MQRLKAASALFALFVALGFGPVGCTPGISSGDGSGGGCCRVCTVGKPCGNTCISASYNCNTPGGCACYGANNEERLASN